MGASRQYKLSLKAIQDSRFEVAYSLDGSFFKDVENDLITNCNIEVELGVWRQADMIILDFSHHGSVHTACDRCLEQIKIPVQGNRQFVLKLTHEIKEEEEDIIYIHWEEDYYDVRHLLNEIITFSLPMVRVYDCENDVDKPCDDEILKYLQSETDDEPSALWDQLKNLDLDDKLN